MVLLDDKIDLAQIPGFRNYLPNSVVLVMRDSRFLEASASLLMQAFSFPI